MRRLKNILITKEVITKWHPVNKNKLVNYGYTFTKIGDEIPIKIEHLSKGSHITIEYKCDYCGLIFPRSYKIYNDKLKNSKIIKDCCGTCRSLKVSESLIKFYGVTSPNQIDWVNKKIIATNLEKYGCEKHLQNKEIIEKRRITMQERYGVDFCGSILGVPEKKSNNFIFK